MQRLAIVFALSIGPMAQAGAQCADPHYRWTVKTTESMASLTPVRASITTMLRSWALLPWTGADRYECEPRAGRELRTYSVTGWVSRVRRVEDDGDWHIEVTARQDSPADSCIVVEIPPGGGNFQQARADFNALVGSTRVGNEDFSPPIRLRFIGAAFFDGEHRGGPTRRDQTDGSHGRCNSSARALWELHPVYFVRRPAS